MAATTTQRIPTLEELYLAHIEHLQRACSAALVECEYDALILHSGRAMRQSRFDDQYWPFKPTPAFAHWLPLRNPNVTLLVQPSRKPRLFIQPVQDFWEGATEQESNHFWSSFDQVEIAELSDVCEHLPSSRVAFIGDVDEPATTLKIASEAINPDALIGRLDAIRTRKTEYERLCMSEANRRAAAGHVALINAFAAGEISELALHLLYLKETAQDDVQTPYKNIVALDEHAGILHHINYSRVAPIGKSQSLLVDAGAMCLGYASDITRTTIKGVVENHPSTVFAELINQMERLQLELIRRIEPGLAYESLHDQSHELLADVLRDLHISDASAEELVDSGATRAFFPHGLGHSLGIQVHDVGCRLEQPSPKNPFLRNTSVIEDGQVFTVEPGCYFIPQLMDQLREQPVGGRIDWRLVDGLSSFGGIRIEDNIAVVDRGTINITRDNWPSTP